MTKNIVLITLDLFLGAFFILMGVLKLWPTVQRELHREVRRHFVQYAKVVPIITWFGGKVSPVLYRKVIGYIELVSGGAILLPLPMIIVHTRVKPFTNVVLFLVMINEIYGHYMVGHKFERK